MTQKILNLVDETYKKINHKKSVFTQDMVVNYEYDLVISRYKYIFSFKNKYSVLKIGDFYFYHSQRLLFEKKDDVGSEILFFLYILVSSFDIDQQQDKEKYLLVKDVINKKSKIEDVYTTIMTLHPVSEEDINLFSFQRIGRKLVTFHRNKPINLVQFVIDYLEDISNIENVELLEMVKEFSIDFIKKVFR